MSKRYGAALGAIVMVLGLGMAEAQAAPVTFDNALTTQGDAVVEKVQYGYGYGRGYGHHRHFGPRHGFGYRRHFRPRGYGYGYGHRRHFGHGFGPRHFRY